MSEHLTRDAFAEQLNTRFDIYFSPVKPSETQLVEVSELRKYARQEIFSLIFLAPPDVPLEQRIYDVRHAALGALELFLVPIERDESGIKYEALFNRRIAGTEKAPVA